ncbi:peptidoglycan-binding domain-containing protein [Streptomyces sp. SID12488]|uniref:peptidoglycan-binding domain-containing protein n=1 Tax=Streptomyces sp. SID12488 TaxID=2706040 RepID=UPI0013D9D895|nr:peptidoglycan-binding domain-containing protein [Streptomyces sp. SID12488]NEA61026.1 peptidoglycan-binding protein [Streptomyces sp. SID12488]
MARPTACHTYCVGNDGVLPGGIPPRPARPRHPHPQTGDTHELTILWADGAIESDGTAFDSADIDGVFGSNTKAATADWQSAFGGSGDGTGVAGDDTFRAAGKGLEDQDGNGAVDHFDGSRYTVNITRDSSGRYNFYDGDGNARLAGYDYRTCS